MKWTQVQLAEVAEIVTGSSSSKKEPGNNGEGVPQTQPPDLCGCEHPREPDSVELGEKTSSVIIQTSALSILIRNRAPLRKDNCQR